MANPLSEETWDWPFILYIGRVWFLYSDDEVWNMTPRKLIALILARAYVEKKKWEGTGSSSSPQGNGYIDQIPGW